MGTKYSPEYLAKRFEVVKAQEGMYAAVYIDGGGEKPSVSLHYAGLTR